MSRYPTKQKRLTSDDHKGLAAKAQNGDREALGMLLDSVLRIVAKEAWRISQPGEDVEDYVQEAAVKLIENLSRYDPAKGKFVTFALPWAAGARHIWQHKQGWQRAYRGVAFESIESVINQDDVNAHARRPLKLENMLQADEDTTVEQESTRRAIRAQIDKANLNRQEQCVLELALRFNLDEGFQTKCAELMDLSRERVGQIWTGRGGKGSIGVIEKLRKTLAPLAEAA